MCLCGCILSLKQLQAKIEPRTVNDSGSYFKLRRTRIPTISLSADLAPIYTEA